MSTFQAVNTTLSVPDPPAARPGDETTPTTPRPTSNFFPELRPSDDPRTDDPSAKTPTRNSFAGLGAQRSLPQPSFTPPREPNKSTDQPPHVLHRESSHRSTQSVDSIDVEMGQDDDGGEGSDAESVTSDTNRPSKKKKGQRFFCIDYPPCHLSFTRSEHLARHIRKHTGERPFQCHCSRRFSRLDNLRQHAQTVHVNEKIPDDSLAATSTRFQRQIRTDRVRPPGNRSRANTLGSHGGHSRGHSRNLSASSIISTGSNMNLGQVQDVRRRPPPLAMANDGMARARLSLNTDMYNPQLMGSPGPQIVEYNSSSANPTSPTSATFSTATDSPGRFGSNMESPASTASRPVSWAGPRTPARRLSVPSGPNAFSGPPGQSQPPYLSPLPSSTSSTFSHYASPNGSNYPESRRDSYVDTDWRRRTWHPGVYSGPRPATSSLGYHQTPDAPRPSFTSQPAASQTTRLPGIESFDQVPPPSSLVRRPSSPMEIDQPSFRPYAQYAPSDHSNPRPGTYHTSSDPATTRPVTYHAPSSVPTAPQHGKRTSISWDIAIQSVNRLDIGSPNPPREQWPREQYYSNNSGQIAASRPTTAPHPEYTGQFQQQRHVPQPIQVPTNEPTGTSQDPPVTPRKNKRHGWYNGPVHQPSSVSTRVVQRTSPEDSSSSDGVPTPSNAMSECHPVIVHSNGQVEEHPSGPPVEEQKTGPSTSIMDRPHPIHYNQAQYRASNATNSYQSILAPERGSMSYTQTLPHTGGDSMRRLEALVAVATSEQPTDWQRSR